MQYLAHRINQSIIRRCDSEITSDLFNTVTLLYQAVQDFFMWPVQPWLEVSTGVTGNRGKSTAETVTAAATHISVAIRNPARWVVATKSFLFRRNHNAPKYLGVGSQLHRNGFVDAFYDVR